MKVKNYIAAIYELEEVLEIRKALDLLDKSFYSTIKNVENSGFKIDLILALPETWIYNTRRTTMLIVTQNHLGFKDICTIDDDFHLHYLSNRSDFASPLLETWLTSEINTNPELES